MCQTFWKFRFEVVNFFIKTESHFRIARNSRENESSFTFNHFLFGKHKQFDDLRIFENLIFYIEMAFSGNSEKLQKNDEFSFENFAKFGRK